MQPIVTLTVNPAVDKSTEVDQVLAERKLRCSSARRDPGGGGINVARAIHELGETSGIDALALYTAGGPTGEILSRLLDDEGVPRQEIPIEAWTRENFVVRERSSDRQYRFGMPGAALAEAEWRRCLDVLRELGEGSGAPPAYLVASGSLPPGAPDDFYGRVARVGRELGCRVIVDTSGSALRPAAEEGVYLLKPNARELGELFPGEPVHEIGLDTAARRLIEERGAEVVVLSLGAAGVLLVTEDRCARIPSPTVEIVSKVGAGDSTVAGMVLALHRGEGLDRAVRFGVAAGAAAVSTPGTELCRRHDVERLFGEMIESTTEPAGSPGSGRSGTET